MYVNAILRALSCVTCDLAHQVGEEVGSAMEFPTLLAAVDLLRSQRQNVIVLMLAARGPCKFSELSQAITAYTLSRPTDQKLTKALIALESSGQIRRDTGRDGEMRWCITAEGSRRVAVLRSLGESFRRSYSDRE